MAKKKHGIDMTADEWFEIEERGMGEGWTMEEVAALGPEGREALHIILTSRNQICLFLTKTFMMVIR